MTELPPSQSGRPSRREAFQYLAALGIGTATFQRAVAAQAQEVTEITPEMIKQAEWVAGLTLSEVQRKEIVGGINRLARSFRATREIELDANIPPALAFVPTPWDRDGEAHRDDQPKEWSAPPSQKPERDEDLAFMSVAELAPLLRDGKVSSVELTKLYLDRLKKYDPALMCVVNLTEDIALAQAERADQELAAGRYRGPLHGIPWGAKDLMAYPGTKTTWGAPQYRDRIIDEKATVARKLEEAGAVLVAKLSLGALAQGDRWYRGMTRNPWNVKQGSSGSSAGSACATSAGLVGFAIGTETLGSIVSPCTRCGVTGLRPTFGRVSRAGCMALAWSMDKVGPIARSVEDCALVFRVIHGDDGLDPAAVDQPFNWPVKKDLADIRVGYVEGREPVEDREELKVLKKLGVKLVPIKLPDDPPASPLLTILDAEAATAFDRFTREGVTEGLNNWPVTFRRGQFIPAVEYIRANRIRSILMQRMRKAIADVDCYVGGNDLRITNLTGHPTVVMPNGFRTFRGVEVPRAITFTGQLFGEAILLQVAAAYQKETGYHLRRPPMEKVTLENLGEEKQ